MSTEVCPPPSPCEIARKCPLLQGSYFSFQAEGSLSIARFSTNIFNIFLQLSLARVGSPLFSVRAESIPSQYRVRHAQLKAKLFASWFSGSLEAAGRLQSRLQSNYFPFMHLFFNRLFTSAKALIIYSFPKMLQVCPRCRWSLWLPTDNAAKQSPYQRVCFYHNL